ncbi:MarR family winged helix-turn-helix transcriptional regulator [Streptomyces sp. DH41]|uniref:MarR family winged helix-turn-helix transcriptional regulator n=1 Tax=Streptomyces sp. DH41 TaxID=3040125 RepID=UPI00244163C3|nr:MarR family transcriptional regulator [Streptomyces sp. DH41]MDG9726730.1 MarR family transcriptional regulator [Streptomyces sp. DH41]
MSEGDANAMDGIVEDWRRERPDLEVSALATIGRLAFVAENVIGPVGERAVGRHGIGKGDFDVLATLRRIGAPYTLSPSALSAELMMSRAGMTKRLDRLEKAGLVERTLDAGDRRSFRITLTAEGRRVADAALTDLAADLSALASELTDTEHAGLDQALQALMRAGRGLPHKRKA